MCQQANVGRLSRNSAEREAGKPLPEVFAATWSGEYWIFRKQDVIVRRISFLSMIEGGLKREHTMKPSHYDALLTFARLLSEVQSGAPKISWQKITPISKKDHRQAWKHLFYIIFFSLVVSGWALWNFSEQRTITLGMLFWAVLPGYALWVLKKELSDAIRILRTQSAWGSLKTLRSISFPSPKADTAITLKIRWKRVAANIYLIGIVSRWQIGKPCFPMHLAPKIYSV